MQMVNAKTHHTQNLFILKKKSKSAWTLFAATERVRTHLYNVALLIGLQNVELLFSINFIAMNGVFFPFNTWIILCIILREYMCT